MTEMIERIATALMDTATSPHFRAVWADQPDDIKTHWRFAARAALQAMREPTDKMLHAATMQVPTWDNDASRRKWQAMVDAALNAQTMLELADDIADIPHEVNLTPRQARLLQAAANRLRETAALPPSQEVPAPPQCAREAVIEECARVADVSGDNAATENGRYMATGIAKHIRALAVTRPDSETP